MAELDDLSRLPDAEVQCLRCDEPMKDAGPMRLHEGTPWGFLGEFGELMVKRREFIVYVCPRCGKAEFFV